MRERYTLDSAYLKIVKLQERIAELEEIVKALKEQERDKHNFAVVPRSLNRDMRIAYHESIERHEDCQEDLGCPDDQWTAMIEAWVVLKEQGK